MKFLGLRLCDHDSSITYTDGVEIKYFKPERHKQIKHFAYENLIDWVDDAKNLGINLKDLTAVAMVIDVHKHPYLNKEDPQKLYELIKIPYSPFTELVCPIFRIDHHYAHSLSSWMLTNVKDHLILDGFGDLKRSISIFNNEKRTKSYTLDQVGSFGMFLGEIGEPFQIKGHPDDIAGKVMALQSFGKLDEKYFNHIKDLSFEDLNYVGNFGNYFKIYESSIACKFNLINFLSTVHHFAESKVPSFVSKYFTNDTAFTYSGGVAHNICINTKLKENFPNMIIPPHCADEGLSLGCVEFLRNYYKQPSFSKNNFPFWQSDEAPKTKPSSKTINHIADQLAKGKIVGWYQGHGEIGPRALGNRSILMSPEIQNGKHIINQRVKHREDYRPFAASIKSEATQKYFDWKHDSNFMKYSVKFKDKIFAPISHIDNTSRIQTVDESHHIFYELLDKFENKTGLPMLLNTSLNDNGKPIAGCPQDALNLFKQSDLDILVIGDKVIKK
tara:strand:- start:3019 stop:4518 length:1500 start_codon:yes stop_codon:yes gene_type:complete